MGASELYQAAFNFLLKFSPIVLIVAVISVADLLITLLMKILNKAPKYNSRRTI